MSKKHPVIAVTGSSGAGTTTVKVAFEHIFTREKIKAALDEGTRGNGRGFVLIPSACPYGRKLSPAAMKNYEVMIEEIERF